MAIGTYFEVDPDVLWESINGGIPALKQQIEKILKELYNKADFFGGNLTDRESGN